MPQLNAPEYVLDDLKRFIVKRYPYYLPNSLLIAQEFILINQHYGKEFGLSFINDAIEYEINQGFFD